VPTYLDNFFDAAYQLVPSANEQSGYIAVVATMTLTPPANDQSDVPAAPSPVTAGYAYLLYSSPSETEVPSPGLPGGELPILIPARFSGTLAAYQLAYGGFAAGSGPGGTDEVGINSFVEDGMLTLAAPRPLQPDGTYSVEINLGGSSLSFVPLTDQANNVLLGNDGPILVTVSLSSPFVVPGS
jgi:hypothetical protein